MVSIILRFTIASARNGFLYSFSGASESITDSILCGMKVPELANVSVPFSFSTTLIFPPKV